MKKNMLSCGGALLALAALLTISTFSISCASNKGASKVASTTAQEASAPSQEVSSTAQEASTTTQESSTTEGASDSTILFNRPVSHSFLTDKNVGDKLTIRGIFGQNQDGYILIENPTSRSRVTFSLVFAETEDSATLLQKYSQYVDTFVEIEGTLLSAASPWSKKMQVSNIK